MLCPCDSGTEYSQCCEPYILGVKPAPTPEALMRSRYTAYVKVATKYLRDTLAPESRTDYNESEAIQWAKQSEWLGLKIIAAKDNTVEFIAKYKTQGKVIEHHEVSTFRKQEDHWYFVDGESQVNEEGKEDLSQSMRTPIVRDTPKVGRNDPCTCGSGKKFKKCCGVNA